MKSLWEETEKITPRKMLDGDASTDVLIIGAGIAGLLCGYMLKEAGVSTITVEQNKVCSGVTKNTTAKITYQHGLIYDSLIKKEGFERASLYLKAQNKAKNKLFEILKNVPCDLERTASFVYSMDDKNRIIMEADALTRLGADATFHEKTELPFSVAGAVSVPDQAHFHPLKALKYLSKDQTVYENTKVLEVTADGARTNRGFIKAKKIIVATHFPFINKHGLYFLKMYQHRSYVLALSGAQKLSGMYVDEKDTGMSFRNYKDLLLLGGGDHRTGKNGGCFTEIEVAAKRFYPEAKEEYRWATQDCITLDRRAYIGRYSNNTPNMFVATGFNKWGMTSSMLSAMMLSDLVLEKENEYTSLFSPSRSILKPQILVNAAESVLGLLTPTAPRCSHLGCALKYNKTEHTWDCSCHGSRFSEKGKVINGPAMRDKKL